MGWYQGLGARLVHGPFSVAATGQKPTLMDSATGLVDCAWVNPVEIPAGNPVDSTDWLSGVYLVKLTELNTHKQSYIVFVVREDSRKADLLFQQSVTTY